jgi:hypothetical protein
MGKSESMSDTEKEIDELQRKLAAKTRDFVAEGILDVPMQIYKAEGAGPKNAYGRHR